MKSSFDEISILREGEIPKISEFELICSPLEISLEKEIGKAINPDKLPILLPILIRAVHSDLDSKYWEVYLRYG